VKRPDGSYRVCVNFKEMNKITVFDPEPMMSPDFHKAVRKSVLYPERQSARMSKITKDGLTRCGAGCFIAVPIWQQWVSKG